MEPAQKTAMSVNPKVNDKWYNIKRFMGEKTQENSVMGYSATYSMGAERCLFLVGVVSWSCSQRP